MYKKPFLIFFALGVTLSVIADAAHESRTEMLRMSVDPVAATLGKAVGSAIVGSFFGGLAVLVVYLKRVMTR